MYSCAFVGVTEALR